MRIEQKLEQLGLVLPEPAKVTARHHDSFRMGPPPWRSSICFRAWSSQPGWVCGRSIGTCRRRGFCRARLRRGAACYAICPRQPQAFSRRSRPYCGVVGCLRDGERRAGLHANDQHHQRLLRPPSRCLRPRNRHARSNSNRYGRASSESSSDCCRGGRCPMRSAPSNQCHAP